MSYSLSELPEPWRVAFKESVASYVERQSVPVGAVVTDRSGSIVAVGGNSFASSRLAHAELAALNAMPATVNRQHCSIYSTVEPCPMCAGAIRMAQLGSVHFAARDPAAGSTSLFSANAFMREYVSEVRGPASPELEFVVVALVLEHRVRTGHHRWEGEWNCYAPSAVAAGKRLAQAGAFTAWRQTGASAEEVYAQVLQLKPAT